MSHGTLLHHVRMEDDNVVSGVVIDASAPLKPLRIKISVDEKVVGIVLAGDLVNRRTLPGLFPDRDLSFMDAVKQQETPSGFSFRIPEFFRAGIDHGIQAAVMTEDGETPIFRQSAQFTETSFADARRFFAEYSYINFETITHVRDDVVAFTGWYSLPDGREDDLAVTVNGQPAFKCVCERLSEPADPLHFAFDRARPSWRFQGEADLAAAPSDPRGFLFSAQRPDGASAGFLHGMNYFLPAYWKECLHDWPAPPFGNVERTNPHFTERKGADGQDLLRAGHFFSGYSSLWHVDHAARAHAGKSLTDCEKILDWGCGAGRLTQHLPRMLQAEIHGVDIDAENIAWAAANIPDVQFAPIGLDPPLPFPDASFDAMIGLSVYTHLSEEDQFRWLAEHRRILKPGGLLLVTVAAESALKRARLPKMIRYAREMRRHGISDSDIPPLFAGMLGNRADYYRNTRHATGYILARWQDYFDIKGIEPSGSQAQQDIVVGVRR